MIKKIYLLLPFIIFLLTCNKENDLVSGVWVRKNDFPATLRAYPAAFSIGNKGYITTGSFDEMYEIQFFMNDLWEYNSDEDTWTQKADFPGLPRTRAVAFTIGSKAYVGTGFYENRDLKDFWEYDPMQDKWTRIADYGGGEVAGAASFSVSGKGYVGPAFITSHFYYVESMKKGFWEYDPDLDKWTEKAEYIGNDSSIVFTGFVYNDKCFLFADGSFKDQFHEYDPKKDKWTKYDIGEKLSSGKALSINNRAYHFSSGSGVYEFSANNWYYIGKSFDTYNHLQVMSTETMGCFSIGNKAYFCTGRARTNEYAWVWEYSLIK